MSPARTGSTFASRRLNAVNSAAVHMEAGVVTRPFYGTKLLLAVRAPIGGPLPLRELFDGFAADTAGRARALVDVELLAEVARITVGADVIAQSGATHFHGQAQRRLDCARELRAFVPREGPRLAPRTDAR